MGWEGWGRVPGGLRFCVSKLDKIILIEAPWSKAGVECLVKLLIVSVSLSVDCSVRMVRIDV